MLKRVKNIFLCLFSIIVLLEFIVIPSSAASGKVYIFTFSTNDINTRAAGNNTVLNHLWNMGYNAGEYLNNSAADAYNILTDSGITVIVSHAQPGAIRLGMPGNYSMLRGDNQDKDVSLTKDRFIYNLSRKSLENSKIIIYVGCNTGITPDPVADSSQITGYRYPANLVAQTHIKGSKCTVGWNKNIYSDSACDWVRLFFEKCDQAHEEIWECFNHADYWVKDIYGNDDWQRLNDRYEKGDIHQRLYQ